MLQPLSKPIIAVTDLRRNFESLTRDLDKFEGIIITRRGEPFALLRSLPQNKRNRLKQLAGSWSGSELDNDRIWSEVRRKTSRKSIIKL